MHEAMLYERLANSAVRCHVCQWCRVIHPEECGRCRVHHNRDGTLEILNYGKISSVTAGTIERSLCFTSIPQVKAFPAEAGL